MGIIGEKAVSYFEANVLVINDRETINRYIKGLVARVMTRIVPSRNVREPPIFKTMDPILAVSSRVSVPQEFC